MKDWLKKKLRKFLEIDEIAKDYNEKLYQQEKSVNERFGEIYTIVRDTERTIQNTLSLVVDVNVSKRDPSWGIICYKHHGQNIVHEFNFGNADGEKIREFIKDFESAYRFVDSPPNIRGYF